MAPSDLILIAAFLIPLALLVALRINAALVFMSLCVGYVLVEFVANDADSLINFMAPDSNSMSASTLRLIMLFLPVVMTALITLFSVNGRVKVFINTLPAAGVSVLGVLLAVPLLLPSFSSAIEAQALWQEVSRAQAAIVGASAFVSLVFLWAQRRGHSGKKHH